MAARMEHAADDTFSADNDHWIANFHNASAKTSGSARVSAAPSGVAALNATEGVKSTSAQDAEAIKKQKRQQKQEKQALEKKIQSLNSEFHAAFSNPDKVWYYVSSSSDRY